MILSEAISGINYALRGLDDDAPTTGDDEHSYWLSVLNRKKDEFYRDATRNWPEAFEVRSLGSVSVSAAPSFNVPTDFIAPSGDGRGAGAYVITTDNQRVDLELVKPEEAGPDTRVAYISGRNPQKLYLSTAVTAGESIVGGTVYLSGYFLPSDLSADSDVLPFADPQWAVLATAAEIAGNDIIYEDKEANLNAKANNLYEIMAQNARVGVHGSPRKVKYAVNSLRRTM